MPGITNLPALLDSFTASLKSSSKKVETCFLETGFSGVLILSARCAIILDLLRGLAIEFILPPQNCKCGSAPASGMPRGTIAVLPLERKGKTSKMADKTGVSHSVQR